LSFALGDVPSRFLDLPSPSRLIRLQRLRYIRPEGAAENPTRQNIFGNIRLFRRTA
jgi:hypothetical protein